MPQTVILTRPEHRNAPLAGRLETRGWNVLNLPALALAPQLPEPGNVPMPDAFDAIVFVSSFAANVYLDGLRKRQPSVVWPDHTLAVTVGHASARPLYEAGFIPHAQIVHPSPRHGGHDSEALWARLQAEARDIRRVLVLRGQSGREWLGSQFEQTGAEVRRLAIYERRPASWSKQQCQDLDRALQQPDKAIMLLTSSEGVKALHGRIAGLGLLPAWAGIRFVAFHQRIATQLQSILQESCLTLQHPVMLCEPSDMAFCQMLDSLRNTHNG
ncbi:MAG TPA: uroporphyrinogen-III synthase [Burkholderiaceae bacterium]|nr:uroporphyrinogen-III synthase [Burkholderiaceae bacterium]